jgi:hypothetical protein
VKSTRPNIPQGLLGTSKLVADLRGLRASSRAATAAAGPSININARPGKPISCSSCGLSFQPSRPGQSVCARDHQQLAAERARLDHALELEQSFR